MKLYKIVSPFLFLLLLVSVESQAQSVSKPDSITSFSHQTIKKDASLFNYKRMSFSIDMGMGFIASKYNSGAYTYISPYLSYMVTPRFKLDVGGILQQGFNGINKTEFGSLGGNNTNVLLFARGNYLVSDRLIISGSVYKTFGNNTISNSDLLKKKNALDNYGMSVGAEYKITDHLTVGAQINYSNGNNNPFYQSQYSPYGGMQPGLNPGHPYRGGFMGW